MSLFRFDPLIPSALFRLMDSQMDTNKESQLANREEGEAPARQIWSPDFFHGPRIDVVEHPDRFVLSAEVPGFKNDDVHLNVDEKARKITISGTIKSEYHSDSAATDKPQQKEDKSRGGEKEHRPSPPRTLISERMFGTFNRSLKLPDSADLAAIKAKMNAGVLNVEIPKYEDQKKAAGLRRVTIEDVPEAK